MDNVLPRTRRVEVNVEVESPDWAQLSTEMKNLDVDSCRQIVLEVNAFAERLVEIVKQARTEGEQQ